jgi:predicted nucleic acid-binding protein
MTDDAGGGENARKPPLRVLVDTNVVLDLVLGREPWASQAKPLWMAHDTHRIEACLLASVLTDVYYICRKQVGVDQAKKAVGECLRRFIILPVDRSLLETALLLAGSDFEDNVQIAAAQEADLRLIVTRNGADFAHSAIPPVEPPEVLLRLEP